MVQKTGALTIPFSTFTMGHTDDNNTKQNGKLTQSTK